jgi:cation:H+ antiporter
LIVAIFLIIIGFILLIKGADFLVDGASSIAKKLNIPQIVIGLTIVSIGTSMPELFVSITSALEEHSDMAIGNVIGSNLCNLLLILGLSTIIMSIKFKRETRVIEIPVCLFVTFIFGIFCNTGLEISKKEAYIFIVLFVIFIIYTIIMGIKGNDDKENTEEVNENTSIFKSLLDIIIGIIALKVGGDFSVDNAIVVAEYFNISEKIISLTILAIGTSLPELVTSVTAAIKGNSDIAIGNILGSNIFNMLLIIGVSAIISPIIYNTSYNMDLIILFWSTLLLSLFPLIPPKNEMNRLNGIIYLLLYAIYICILFI